MLKTLLMTTCRNHSSHFEKHKTAIEEGGGRDEIAEDDELQPGGAEPDSRPDSIRVEEEKRPPSETA